MVVWGILPPLDINSNIIPLLAHRNHTTQFSIISTLHPVHVFLVVGSSISTFILLYMIVVSISSPKLRSCTAISWNLVTFLVFPFFDAYLEIEGQPFEKSLVDVFYFQESDADEIEHFWVNGFGLQEESELRS